MNMQSTHNSFEFMRVDAESLFPRPQRCFVRFAGSRFIEHPQECLSGLALRHDLVEYSRKLPVNASTHYFVYIKTLTIQKAQERCSGVARSLEQLIESIATRIAEAKRSL